jgi:predicted  nucleic acid-binding Zn-ribbon protein
VFYIPTVSSIDTIQLKERDLDISKSDATSAQQKADELASKLRDLQEQIQADDRAEKLEISLKGLQERSSSLESQLARVRQVIWTHMSTFEAYLTYPSP